MFFCVLLQFFLFFLCLYYFPSGIQWLNSIWGPFFCIHINKTSVMCGWWWWLADEKSNHATAEVASIFLFQSPFVTLRRSFAVNIGPDEQEITLHINPRFNAHGDENVVVCNSYQGGNWCEEHREGDFPFRHGEEFKVRGPVCVLALQVCLQICSLSHDFFFLIVTSVGKCVSLYLWWLYHPLRSILCPGMFDM